MNEAPSLLRPDNPADPLAEAWPDPGGQGWRGWLVEGAMLLGRRLRETGMMPIALDAALERPAQHLSRHGFSPDTAHLALAAAARLAFGFAAAPDEARFRMALELLADGLEQRWQQQGETPDIAIFVPLLTALMDDVRESAEASFSGVSDLAELDRQLLVLIDTDAGRTQAELARLTGRDRAQISRAVARMAADGLLDPNLGRGPIGMLPAGKALAAQMGQLMQDRNRDMIEGLDAERRTAFVALIARLVARARRMAEAEALGPETGRLYGDQIDLAASLGNVLIVPPLFALLAYVQRYTAIAVRPLGLTLFDTTLLGALGNGEGLGRKQLVTRLGRDQAQAGKRLAELEGKGLIARQPAGGRRIHIVLTPAGEQCCTRLLHITTERDRMLLGHLAPDELRLLIDVATLVAANARALSQRVA